MTIALSGHAMAVIGCAKARRPQAWHRQQTEWRVKRGRVLWVAGLAAVCAGSMGAQAQETGSVSQGLLIAEERCAVCHAITRGAEYSPTFGAPTFEQIAITPGMTATALSATLKTSHLTMPNLMLSSDELSNITAYILNLKNE